jgi:pimeloyl-ACP methyl ester carboxylesterase
MPFLRAAGHRLEYERFEGAGGPTLVFLHEGLGCVTRWRDFPRFLARETGCPAVVYSRAGYGQSDRAPLPRPLSFMHDEARGALPEVLELLHIDEAILIGHSDGASIALIHAGDSGTKVRGLILEAPHVFVEDICIASIAQLRAEWGQTDLREKLARHHADVDGMFRGWADAWLEPAFRQWNLEAYLPGIRVPVMVIQGEQDQYGTAAQVDAICTQVSGPCEQRMLPDCGHSPHRDKPGETLAAMARFIRAVTPSAIRSPP